MDPHPATDPLPVGTRLREFVIRQTLGRGGVGIVYAAEHGILRETFALKEFLPGDLARRADGNRVEPLPGKEVPFEKVRAKFLEEGQTLIALARPRPHPNLVQVTDAFHDNDTVYITMRFERGRPLDAALGEILLREPNHLDEATLRGWLLPLLDGLEHAHAHQVWHRDIKPSNILIRDDGSPVLIDFGAARRERPDSPVSVIMQYTPDFAAPEQLFGGAQGPWTDIYAMAATLFWVVTGRPPPRWPLTSDWHGQYPHYSERLLAAIDAGLQANAEERPRDVAQWRRLFELPGDPTSPPARTIPRPAAASVASSAHDAPTVVRAPPATTATAEEATLVVAPAAAVPPSPTPPPRPKAAPWLFAVVGGALLALLALLLVAPWEPERQDPPTLSDVPEPARPEPAQPAPPVETPAPPPPLAADEPGLAPTPAPVPVPVPAPAADDCPPGTAPFCAIVTRLRALAPPASRTAALPDIQFNHADRVYREDDTLMLMVHNDGPDDGYLYLDFIDRDGNAMHLFPTATTPGNFVAAGTRLLVGTATAAECQARPDDCFIVSRPHGNNLVLATWSTQPLFTGPRLPQAEPADAYLATLAGLLENSQREGASRHAIAAHFFETRP